MVEQLCRSRAGFTLAMVGVAAGMACAALVGCAPRSSQPPLGFADFLRDLTNTVELARLDCADTRLVLFD